MKRLLWIVAVVAVPFFAHAQDYSSYRDFEFKKREDYIEQQGKVLEMANYILNVPVDGANLNRLIALQTLIKWMSGTPDYQFALDESLSGLMKKNDEIVALFMASAAKYQLETQTKEGTSVQAKLSTYKILLEYCEKESNGMKKTKELQKAIDAKNKGELQGYLKI